MKSFGDLHKKYFPQLNHLPVQIENDQSEAKRHRQDEDDRGREPLLMPPNPHRFPPGFPPGAPEPHNPPLPPHAPPLFLPPLGLPLPPDKSPVFPGMIDPRPLYMQVGFFLKFFVFDSIVLQWAAAQQPMPSPFLPGMQQTNPGYLQVSKSFSSNHQKSLSILRVWRSSTT